MNIEKRENNQAILKTLYQTLDINPPSRLLDREVILYTFLSSDTTQNIGILNSVICNYESENNRLKNQVKNLENELKIKSIRSGFKDVLNFLVHFKWVFIFLILVSLSSSITLGYKLSIQHCNFQQIRNEKIK